MTCSADAKAVGHQPEWNGLHNEPLFIGASVFIVLCYAMSQYSQRGESWVQVIVEIIGYEPDRET